MGRIVILIVIAFLVWLVFRGFFRVNTRGQAQPPAHTGKGEDMVACARCGVNLPRSSTALDGDKLVCADNPKCVEAPK
jgi:uncharacterized protein